MIKIFLSVLSIVFFSSPYVYGYVHGESILSLESTTETSITCGFYGRNLARAHRGARKSKPCSKVQLDSDFDKDKNELTAAVAALQTLEVESNTHFVQTQRGKFPVYYIKCKRDDDRYPAVKFPVIDLLNLSSGTKFAYDCEINFGESAVHSFLIRNNLTLESEAFRAHIDSASTEVEAALKTIHLAGSYRQASTRDSNGRVTAFIPYLLVKTDEASTPEARIAQRIRGVDCKKVDVTTIQNEETPIIR